jgi:hypothetical protein
LIDGLIDRLIAAAGPFGWKTTAVLAACFFGRSKHKLLLCLLPLHLQSNDDICSNPPR